MQSPASSKSVLSLPTFDPSDVDPVVPGKLGAARFLLWGECRASSSPGPGQSANRFIVHGWVTPLCWVKAAEANQQLLTESEPGLRPFAVGVVGTLRDFLDSFPLRKHPMVSHSDAGVPDMNLPRPPSV